MPMSKTNLSSKVAIITGGAGLLGQKYGQTLSEAGAHVVVADILGQEANELANQITQNSGIEALGFETNVSDPGSVKTMTEKVLDRFNRIDILVNNAALDPKFDTTRRNTPDQDGFTNRFEEFPFEDWQRAIDVNITGMFLCAQAVAPTMQKHQSGVIVNISSTYGIVGPDQSLYQRDGEPQQFKPVTYSVSKAAVLGLTKYLATYFRGTGIRVNTLSPGGVYTDHDEEFVLRYSAKTLLGRMARPDEISSALLFLVSEASSYMTGANLIVDGGWTAW
jgi:2-deoxy-D-gluconate 3-dehydrogenase